jgi:hypothetical protein
MRGSDAELRERRRILDRHPHWVVTTRDVRTGYEWVVLDEKREILGYDVDIVYAALVAEGKRPQR